MAAPQTPEQPGVWDEALEPAQLRSLNSTLRKLADSDGGNRELQEAAKKLMSGRITLRDALDDPSVSRGLLAGTASLREKWEAASEEEREAVREEQPAPDDGPTLSSGDQKKPPGRHSGGFSLY
ncbi:hypothetical protein [Streptomyces beijiangensis]|uniref:Uncharacterized protein n=1 Tax=Streptomyces beijiangensis TaxID=163361 RepID=A0A939JGN0_9ACTN|nr:hypothetical protein [Streptomyces beijiangensis]MBO0511265.1 hypothetical protein [Streptomyces beijiangensis]